MARSAYHFLKCSQCGNKWVMGKFTKRRQLIPKIVIIGVMTIILCCWLLTEAAFHANDIYRFLEQLSSSILRRGH